MAKYNVIPTYYRIGGKCPRTKYPIFKNPN